MRADNALGFQTADAAGTYRVIRKQTFPTLRRKIGHNQYVRTIVADDAAALIKARLFSVDRPANFLDYNVG